MKKIIKLISMMLCLCMIFGVSTLVYAAGNQLSEDEKSAFIVRDEWTTWVESFKKSLDELDKQATQKIYANMDFYDMQYRFTEKYKKVPQYLDTEGKPTDELKQLIKETRKKLNRG